MQGLIDETDQDFNERINAIRRLLADNQNNYKKSNALGQQTINFLKSNLINEQREYYYPSLPGAVSPGDLLRGLLSGGGSGVRNPQGAQPTFRLILPDGSQCSLMRRETLPPATTPGLAFAQYCCHGFCGKFQISWGVSSC